MSTNSIRYYTLTDCCDPSIQFNVRLDKSSWNPFWGPDVVWLYAGPTTNYVATDGSIKPLENNKCYHVEGKQADIAVVLGYDVLQDTSFFYTGKTVCEDKQPLDADYAICPTCVTPCFKLTNCDGDTFLTITDLSAYVNTFITIDSNADCWFVEESPNECSGVTTTVTYVSACSACTCNCYTVSGTGTISYIGCDNVAYSGVLAPVQVCALTKPIFDSDGSGTITTSAGCVDGECPEICYKLTECTTGAVINSKSQNLFAYLGNVVTIEGQAGCYTVEATDPDYECDCPIDVIVRFDYVDCTACEPTIAYRLTSCDNEEQIIYTTQDLSEYKNKVVELEDPCGCYTVEEINVVPPSDTTVVIQAGGFDTCTECKTTYYKLTSCDGVDPITYTSTDLSAYVGRVIQLVGCEKCFTVSEFIGVPTNPVGVTFYSQYTDCAACLKDFACRCSTIYNEGDKEDTFTYIDCNGINQITAPVPAKSRSERYCVIRWTSGTLPLYHGNCTQRDADSPWTCPVQTYPVKSIKPGYNTPSCSIEKYEKISCNFGEQLYKSVVQKRYGVSSCCPEEIDKWTIKKELIELQALVDPNYTCSTSPSTCGCNSSNCTTCNCSTPKTCSS